MRPALPVGWLLAVVLAGCGPDPLPGEQETLAWEKIGIASYEPSAAQKRLDVVHYALDLTVDVARRAVTGRMTVRGTKEPGLDVLELDLYENMKVVRVTAGDRPLHFTRSPRHKLRIDLPDREASRFETTIAFAGRPFRVASNSGWECGLRFDRIGVHPVVNTCFQPFFARSLLPCKDHPSDKADEGVALAITVPKPLVVVATGHLDEVTEALDGHARTFHWCTRYPVATNVISFAAAQYVEIKGTYETLDGKRLALRHYVLPESKADARRVLARVARVLAIYERRFGPYPFVDDKFCLVETSYAGLENQTAIAYGSDFPRPAGRGEYDYYLVHEAAHEWAGNAVTCADWRDVWLHEGLATYAEGLYLEARDGRDTYLDLARWWQGRAGDEALTDRDLNSDADIFKSPIVYQRAAAVLHMLRGVLGDKPFLAGLQAYLTDPHLRYKNARTADFRRVMERASGRELGAFFRAWVQGGGRFICEYETRDDGRSVTVGIRSVSGQPEPHRLPVTIRFSRAGQVVDRRVEAGRDGAVVSVALPGAGVRFDPDDWLLKGAFRQRVGLIETLRRH